MHEESEKNSFSNVLVIGPRDQVRLLATMVIVYVVDTLLVALESEVGDR